MLIDYFFSIKEVKILIGVILFFGITSNSLFAQIDPTPRVSLTNVVGSSEELIKLLESESGWVISYSSRLCKKENARLLSGNHTLLDQLNHIFTGCSFDYVIRGNRIILKPLTNGEHLFTVSGYVLDGETGESLPVANVYQPGDGIGTTSNNYGYYSLSLTYGQWRLRASYVGYQAKDEVFDISCDTVINFRLSSTLQLKEVSVLGFSNPEIAAANRMGAMVLSVDEIRSAPALLGETDLIKNIQMLPGVQGGSEGFSGLYVRGGGPDQNLILLDDVPVYNIGHLLGFFSIFNADAVKYVSVLKGGFPARYGGRLSSVVDVRMIEGNHEKIKGSVNLGLLSSGISLDGPIKKNKSGFSLSFRRTYLDIIRGLVQDTDDESTNYYFFDLNGKYNYTFNPRSRIYLSAYLGRDKYSTSYNYVDVTTTSSTDNTSTYQLHDENSAGWGNYVSAIRWNYLFSNKLFGNFTATYSNYRFFIAVQHNSEENNTWDTLKQRYVSGIQDASMQADFDYYPSSGNLVKFGAKTVYHLFNPGVDFIQSGINTESAVDTTIGDYKLNGWENHLYYENEFTPGENLRVNLGGRMILFRGDNKSYWSVEPRVSVHYAFTTEWAIRSSFSSMSQFVHLVSSSNVTLPTDLWLPVTNKIPPMRAQQVSLGCDRDFGPATAYSVSVDVYYKWMRNILHYKESTGFFDYSTQWEDKLTGGNGISYGLELLMKKNSGPLTGWIGYTLARSDNKFEELNDGKSFPARFDRRHDVGVSLNYRFNERIDGGLMWQYGTGSPVTLPSEKYYSPDLPFIGSSSNPGYSENAVSINGYRMPSYHRLDFGFNFQKKLKWGERIWNVGVINVYGRKNPFMLYYASSEGTTQGESTQRQLKQLSIFSFPIPYVKYTFKF